MGGAESDRDAQISKTTLWDGGKRFRIKSLIHEKESIIRDGGRYMTLVCLKS